ncbi:MAG: hypothetical protein ISS54_04125 [Dehalococcoidia bacterium]|nr:hypothetical protein [Dehalococcoidia bacterium]
MLPPSHIFQQKINSFNTKYPHSRFNVFCRYKQRVETTGASILNQDNLDETTVHIDGMLRDPDWGLDQTGIPRYLKVRSILEGVAGSYDKIRHIKLGDGRMASIREELALAYRLLEQIANNKQSNNDPDQSGAYYVVAKSKVLMFIWGQTPGFDTQVRSHLVDRSYPPAPFQLPHVPQRQLLSGGENRRYTPDEFCNILEELDEWVQKWPANNGGQSLDSLYPAWPTGRIIDVTYYLRDP